MHRHMCRTAKALKLSIASSQQAVHSGAMDGRSDVASDALWETLQQQEVRLRHRAWLHRRGRSAQNCSRTCSHTIRVACSITLRTRTHLRCPGGVRLDPARAGCLRCRPHRRHSAARKYISTRRPPRLHSHGRWRHCWLAHLCNQRGQQRPSQLSRSSINSHSAHLMQRCVSFGKMHVVHMYRHNAVHAPSACAAVQRC